MNHYSTPGKEYVSKCLQCKHFCVHVPNYIDSHTRYLYTCGCIWASWQNIHTRTKCIDRLKLYVWHAGTNWNIHWLYSFWCHSCKTLISRAKIQHTSCALLNVSFHLSYISQIFNSKNEYVEQRKILFIFEPSISCRRYAHTIFLPCCC